jgi:hypothetical protein
LYPARPLTPSHVPRGYCKNLSKRKRGLARKCLAKLARVKAQWAAITTRICDSASGAPAAVSRPSAAAVLGRKVHHRR